MEEKDMNGNYIRVKGRPTTALELKYAENGLAYIQCSIASDVYEGENLMITNFQIIGVFGFTAEYMV